MLQVRPTIHEVSAYDGGTRRVIDIPFDADVPTALAETAQSRTALASQIVRSNAAGAPHRSVAPRRG